MSSLSNPPLVSVIMNCYNSGEFLREAIDSVYSQTYANWEIIFFDNASTDNSAEIAKSYDSKLRYYREEKTITLGAARNKAIALVRGEFVAFLDCDDIWLPCKLEKQIPLFHDNNVNLVYSDVINFNLAGVEKRLYERRKFYIGDCFRELLGDYCLSLVTVMVRHSALLSQPFWFDERLQVSEEVDLFLRLAYCGQLAIIPEPLAKYRIHSQSLTIKRPDLFWKECEQILEQYEKLFPDFNMRFAIEIRKWRLMTLCSKAAYLWMAGNAVEARRILWPYLNFLRPFIVYLLCFFFFFFGRMIKRERRIIPTMEI